MNEKVIFLSYLPLPSSTELVPLYQSSPTASQPPAMMAPGKGKSDTNTGINDAALILDYLLVHTLYVLTFSPPAPSSKPVGEHRIIEIQAIDISANLHNKVSKAQAAKLLRELHQNGEIEGRTAGRQIVYHSLQDPVALADAGDIETLNQEIEECQNQLSITKAGEKKIRAALVALQTKPRLCDLRQEIQRLDEERVALQGHLNAFSDNENVLMAPEDRENLERQWKHWQRQAIVRRRLCRELWRQCSEVLPENTTSQELWGRAGVLGA
ncbi:TBPIP-domain-containing protein [Penicillium macrosclerotiorum]|uniref:TBPIP-domain-containing protein n=1 Tax=Penicillium macrosclerotiorum TaxID=303699 RepID=UPI00254709F8|nr:TBPIP-domain-containing protein [Penicillium macrosclerotiorum]KAJ5692095.1 TBPIP-domain-containing protein [Penicillium macrosclerotiorum]